MSIAVGSAQVVKVVDNVLSLRTESVRNDGPNAATLSTDPDVVAGGGFQLAASAVQDVSLEVGEALYAICASGQTAALEVI